MFAAQEVTHNSTANNESASVSRRVEHDPCSRLCALGCLGVSSLCRKLQNDSRIQILSVDNHKGLYFQPGAVLELFPQQETPPTVVTGARYIRKKRRVDGDFVFTA